MSTCMQLDSVQHSLSLSYWCWCWLRAVWWADVACLQCLCQCAWWELTESRLALHADTERVYHHDCELLLFEHACIECLFAVVDRNTLTCTDTQLCVCLSHKHPLSLIFMYVWLCMSMYVSSACIYLLTSVGSAWLAFVLSSCMHHHVSFCLSSTQCVCTLSDTHLCMLYALTALLVVLVW